MFYFFFFFRSNLIWYLDVSENENLPEFIVYGNFQAISMVNMMNYPRLGCSKQHFTLCIFIGHNMIYILILTNTETGHETPHHEYHKSNQFQRNRTKNLTAGCWFQLPSGTLRCHQSHGRLGNPHVSMEVSGWENLISMVDFPACHFWWHQRLVTDYECLCNTQYPGWWLGTFFIFPYIWE